VGSRASFRVVSIISRHDGYELSTDPARVDVDRVHRWLSSDAYWAIGRPREVVQRAIAGSVVFGVYRLSDGEQVAFARTVTDEATFAWLCDVYVDRSARGHGIGTWMVTCVRDHLVATGVKRVLLATLDAHGVYEKVGFTPLAVPDRWMEFDRREATRDDTE
jgi:predicted GNAT family acetyltransferase